MKTRVGSPCRCEARPKCGSSACGSNVQVKQPTIDVDGVEWAAVGLDGALGSVLICENDLNSPTGIVNIGEKDATGLMDLRIEDNQFACERAGVRLTGVSVHQKMSRLTGNRVTGCAKGGFVLTGATVPGFGIEVVGNEFEVSGDGIVAGVNGLRIKDNDLIPLKPSPKNQQRGIVLTKGMTRPPLEDCQIVGNRISGQIVDGKNVGFANAIIAEVPLGLAAIARNQIADAQFGLLVGAVERLTVDSNQMVRIIETAVSVKSASGRVAACGNQFETLGGKTGVIIECPKGDCVFSHNHSQQTAKEGVLLNAGTLIVASNRMQGQANMNLQHIKACTVIGNITGGGIIVAGTALAPAPFEPHNHQNVV